MLLRRAPGGPAGLRLPRKFLALLLLSGLLTLSFGALLLLPDASRLRRLLLPRRAPAPAPRPASPAAPSPGGAPPASAPAAPRFDYAAFRRGLRHPVLGRRGAQEPETRARRLKIKEIKLPQSHVRTILPSPPPPRAITENSAYDLEEPSWVACASCAAAPRGGLWQLAPHAEGVIGVSACMAINGRDTIIGHPGTVAP